MRLSEHLGYDILPAIAAMKVDGLAQVDVAGELASAEANVCSLLRDCEKQHKRLQAGTTSERCAIKSGHSVLYALLVDAYGIIERSLQLVEWLEIRARWTEY